MEASQSGAAVMEPPKAEKLPKPRRKPQSVINAKRERTKRKKGFEQKELRVAIDSEEYDEAQKLLRDLQRSTETNVSISHVVRAFLSLSIRARDAIRAHAGGVEAKAVPPRPPNSSYVEIAKYEEKLADFLLLALQDRDYME